MTMPLRLSVPVAGRSYDIHIGHGLLTDTPGLARRLPERRLAIVTNSRVGPLYASYVRAARGNLPTVEIVLPDGEQHKTLATVERIFDVLVANRFARDDVLLALGGGVVGDVCGFAAACYQRGVDFIQVPTTLLAQVDSSVGGKTGVNHPGGKNLIGAFHQPIAVIADTATLATLPAREMRAGIAEVIKYGLISDALFFDWLEANLDALMALEPQAVSYAVHRCCTLKAEIVGRDEREQGERALLNLGHTFGHAIETVTGYQSWLHGEAVAVGLAMASTMSARAGWMSSGEVDRVMRLLQRAGLRTDARGDVTAAAAREAMSLDKKVKSGRLRLILMRGIGQAFVTADFPEDALDAALEAHLA
jgi:3-dehydroquinate synthase